MDVGCYGVNAARWAFGAEPVSLTGQQVLDPESGVDVAFLGGLQFGVRQLASIDSSFLRAPSNEYAIEGSNGMLRVEQAFRPDDDPGRIHIVSADGRHTLEETPPANQYANQVDHFARSVEAGQLLPPAEDGVAQTRVIEALYASAAALGPRR
jgi:predicted dehydrogenase